MTCTLGPCLGLVAALFVSACTCASPVPGGDARGDAATDAPSRDLAPDKAPDISPDLYPNNDSVCGGSRTLPPQKLPPGTPTPCGAACKQITFVSGMSNRFDIAGDLAVFVFHSIPFFSDTIGFVRLRTGEVFQVRESSSISSDNCRIPTTDGHSLAYMCFRSKGDFDTRREIVAIYDTQTHVERDLACLEKRPRTDHCVVFELGLARRGAAVSRVAPGGNCRDPKALWQAFDKPTLETISKDKIVVYLHAEGDIVVWTEGNDQTKAANVVAYDLRTGKKVVVDPSPRGQFHARTDGRYVVWADCRHDPHCGYANWANSDIYRHDLKTGKTELVSQNPAQQIFPDVSGKWVTWQDCRNDPVSITPDLGHGNRIDVYVKNMETGKEYNMTAWQLPPPLIQAPKVNARHLIYQANSSDRNGNLFLVDLDAYEKAQAKKK